MPDTVERAIVRTRDAASVIPHPIVDLCWATRTIRAMILIPAITAATTGPIGLNKTRSDTNTNPVSTTLTAVGSSPNHRTALLSITWRLLALGMDSLRKDAKTSCHTGPKVLEGALVCLAEEVDGGMFSGSTLGGGMLAPHEVQKTLPDLI